MLRRQVLTALLPAPWIAGPQGQAFQAIAVIGAMARVGIACQVMRYANMTHLGMHQAVQQRPFTRPPPPIPVPIVNKSSRRGPGPRPSNVRPGRDVHIRVEGHGDASAAERGPPMYCPARFRSRGYIPERR